MSNTRYAKDGSGQSDERYASDPLLSKGLKAGDVVRRCETLEAPEQIELALFLQYASNLPGALEKLADDLLSAFPDRIGTAAMIGFHLKPSGNFNADQVRAVRAERPFSDFSFLLKGEAADAAHYFDTSGLLDDGPRPGESFREAMAREMKQKHEEAERARECDAQCQRHPTCYPASVFLDICRKHFTEEAPALIRRYCLDPGFGIEQLKIESFHDLANALLEYMDQWEKKTLAGLVVTAVGSKVLEALNYAEDQKCLALVEGYARTGKTFIAKAWCAARPGRRRIVSLSEATSDKEFFREIAKAIGASASHTFKANELRERVNDILRAGHLTLCLDEAHFLWPQRNLREAVPRRIEWVRASLANYGVPVAMIATQQFSRSQQQIEKHTNWSSEQLIGRIAFCAKLPDQLEKEDIAAVARFHLPEAEERSISFLVNYVIASKKHLASIDHGVRAARHEARKAGRSKVTHGDVMRGFNSTVLPSDRNLIAATEAAKGPTPGRKHGQSKVYAEPLQRPSKQISAPVPERDSGAGLLVKPGRRSVPAVASLEAAET